MGVYGNGDDKKRKQKATTPSITYGRYITYDLTADDKEWLASADLEAEFPQSEIDALVASDYKFSLSFDARNHTFIATLTDKNPSSAWAGYSLSGRGATASDARFSLLYRHMVVAAGDWGRLSTGGGGSAPRFG